MILVQDDSEEDSHRTTLNIHIMHSGGWRNLKTKLINNIQQTLTKWLNVLKVSKSVYSGVCLGLRSQYSSCLVNDEFQSQGILEMQTERLNCALFWSNPRIRVFNMEHRILILSKYQPSPTGQCQTLLCFSLHLSSYTTHHTITPTQTSTLYVVQNKYQSHAHS